MPRTDAHGHEISQAIGWLLGRPVLDKEMADALGWEASSYSKRSKADDFPTFEQLTRLAEYFQLSARVLQIWFAFLGEDIILVLTDEELVQYTRLGGGSHPTAPWRGGVMTATKTTKGKPRWEVQADKPGLDLP
jgi:transcriptional regulator with XRE-family HTH domain